MSSGAVRQRSPYDQSLNKADTPEFAGATVKGPVVAGTFSGYGDNQVVAKVAVNNGNQVAAVVANNLQAGYGIHNGPAGAPDYAGDFVVWCNPTGMELGTLADLLTYVRLRVRHDGGVFTWNNVLDDAAGNAQFAGTVTAASLTLNGDFVWDAVNSRLGIGVASPQYLIHAKADVLSGHALMAFEAKGNNVNAVAGFKLADGQSVFSGGGSPLYHGEIVLDSRWTGYRGAANYLHGLLYFPGRPYFGGHNWFNGQNVLRMALSEGGNLGLGSGWNYDALPPARLSFEASTDAAGGINFGADTNLYRSATHTLKTDDSLEVGGRLIGVVEDLRFVFSGGGATLDASGETPVLTVDYDCQVVGWTLVAAPSETTASVTVDVEKYATYPSSPTGLPQTGTKPNLDGTGAKKTGTTANWVATTIAAGSEVRAFITGTPTNCTWCCLTLKVKRT